MESSECILELVRKAFGAVSYPKGKLCEGSFIRAPEWEDVCGRFRGKRWSDLQLEFLLDHYDALYAFAPAAYRYFLPAFLTTIVSRYDDADHLTDEVISTLTPPIWRDCLWWRTVFNPFALAACIATHRQFYLRVREFTLPERESIHRCLRFLSCERKHESAKIAEQYWAAVGEKSGIRSQERVGAGNQSGGESDGRRDGERADDNGGRDGERADDDGEQP